jgi:eukaryotic-like serine/threonine-protein kinase
MSAPTPPLRVPRPSAPSVRAVTSGSSRVEHSTVPGLSTAPESYPPAATAIGAGTVVAGKYRIERALSRGAMGSVWVATHLALDTPVAIKFMSLHSPPGPNGSDPASQTVESRARFEREAKAAAQVRSANVVQILDYGVDGSMPYIVMELLQGEDLGARLKRVGRMPLTEVSRLVRSVARALQRAHDAGLVHRDLKPGNIFLAKEGDDEVPKVLDFGVAKALSADRPIDEGTQEGTLVGTPSYMSPEQAMGRTDVDHRSDLWSVGVVTFRALTGVKPFPSDSLLEVVVQICTSDAPRASQIVPDLPPEVDAFFERALQRDPAARFQSARDMARALAAVSSPVSSASLPSVPPGPRNGALGVQDAFEDSGEPVVPSGSRRSPSARRRRRRLVWIGIVGALVALTGIVILLARSKAPATLATAPSASTATAAPTSTEVPSHSDPPTPEVPTSGAAAAFSSASAAPVQPAPHASAPRPTSRPSQPASPPPRKPRHDLGY